VFCSINRRYAGCEVVVKVLSEGFEYQARNYRSLSAIAREVTGIHKHPG
jgi:hypothetical protein